MQIDPNDKMTRMTAEPITVRSIDHLLVPFPGQHAPIT